MEQNFKKLGQESRFPEIIHLYLKCPQRVTTKSDLLIVGVAFANVKKFKQSVSVLSKLYSLTPADCKVGFILANVQGLANDTAGALATYKSLTKHGCTNHVVAELQLLAKTGQSDLVAEKVIRYIEKYPEICTSIIYQRNLKSACLLALRKLRTLKAPKGNLLIAKILATSGRYTAAASALRPMCIKDVYDDDIVAFYIGLISKRQELFDRSISSVTSEAGIDIEQLGPKSLNDYAVTIARYGQIKKATKLLEVCIKKADAPIDAYLNLSDLYQDLGEFGKSWKLLKELALKHTDHPKIIKKTASYFSKTRQTLKALSCYEELRVVTNDASALTGLVKCYQDLALQEKAEELMPTEALNGPELVRYYLYNSHYLPNITTQELLKRYDKCGQMIAKRMPTGVEHSYSNKTEYSSPTMRVGILSSDFFNHPTYKFIGGFLALDNFNDVELFLISNTTRKDDVTAMLLKDYGSRFVDVSVDDTESGTQRIKALRLDYLIDLNGHTGNHRMDILARRVARYQIATMGLMCTTGLPFFDYLMLPQKYGSVERKNIHEKMLPLESVIPYTADLKVSSLSSNFSNNEKRMISCSRLIRHNERLWGAWAEIQSQTNARLIINCIDMGDQDVRNSIRARLRAAGLRDELISLKFSTPIDTAYDEADVTLDTFPANSGTTLFESIFCGKPFVSLNEVDFIGEIGSSILQEIGRNELICTSINQYIERAVFVLNNYDYRRQFFEDRHEFSIKLSDKQKFAKIVVRSLRRIKIHG